MQKFWQFSGLEHSGVLTQIFLVDVTPNSTQGQINDMLKGTAKTQELHVSPKGLSMLNVIVRDSRIRK